MTATSERTSRGVGVTACCPLQQLGLSWLLHHMPAHRAWSPVDLACAVSVSLEITVHVVKGATSVASGDCAAHLGDPVH